MIKDNLLRIREKIISACAKARRNPEEITIIGVAKGRSAPEVSQLLAAGINDIGENKVQEALAKYNELSAKYRLLKLIDWHMLGHLQTNKVKEALGVFCLIHSVDSLRLAQEISRQAARINKVQDVLVEIKVSPEPAKFGVLPDEATEFIKEISGLANINIKGLMTIAPAVDETQKTRPYFRQLRELRDKINEIRNRKYEIRILSMGMSDDFEIAIEEGATIVRLGRALFEEG